MNEPGRDTRLANLALERGLCTREQIDRARRECRARRATGRAAELGQILLGHGALGASDLADLERAASTRIGRRPSSATGRGLPRFRSQPAGEAAGRSPATILAAGATIGVLLALVTLAIGLTSSRREPVEVARGVEPVVAGSDDVPADGQPPVERPPEPLPAPERRPLRLRPIPLEDGLRQTAPGGDRSRLVETGLYQIARTAGVDLLRPGADFLVATADGESLFYLFFLTLDDAFGERAYLVQRSRRTERTWAFAGGPPSTSRVSHRVEVFKTFVGSLKKPARHVDRLALGEDVRREVVTEMEIGFGEIPGRCEGGDWPFEQRTLFHDLQPWQDGSGLFGEVRFEASIRWSLRAAVARDGTWSVVCSELGIEAPGRLPGRSDALASPVPASAGIVLEARQGVGEITIGRSGAADLDRAFGPPIEVKAAGADHVNRSYGVALTFNLDGNDRVNTVITAPGFAGRTSRGVRHGDRRAEVLARHGPPDGPADRSTLRFDGILFTFDAFDRVVRIVLFADD